MFISELGICDLEIPRGEILLLFIKMSFGTWCIYSPGVEPSRDMEIFLFNQFNNVLLRKLGMIHFNNNQNLPFLLFFFFMCTCVLCANISHMIHFSFLIRFIIFIIDSTKSCHTCYIIWKNKNKMNPINTFQFYYQICCYYGILESLKKFNT